MPKPAVLTHANFDASLRAILALPVDLVDADHVVLGVIPLFHVFGLNTMVNLGLAIGATLVLADFESPAQVGALAAEHGVTMMGGPPNLWLALARDPATSREQLETVELAISGAAKLAPVVHQEVEHQLGIQLREGYGLTESAAVVATAVGTDAPVGSVGRILPGIEARLVDDDGDDVLVGDPGRLLIRGPVVTPGYWAPSPTPDPALTPGAAAGARPAITPVADEEGWLDTGDVAVVDDDGHLAIVDRAKDLVIVSGFNVYPGEVETVLTTHPAVAAAAVTGEPDPATGEALVAHVVAVPGADLDTDDLLAHCRTQLARYKVPRRVEVRAELPLGLGGKIRRHELS